MNKTKLLLALLIVLVFLLGLFAGARIFYHEDESKRPDEAAASHVGLNPTQSAAEATETSTQYLLNLLEEAVVEVRVINRASSLCFVPDVSADSKAKPLQKEAAETLYRLESPEWELINQAEVQTLVQSLFTVRVAKSLGAKDEWESYGLSPAVTRVIYKMKDGRTQALLVGQRLADGKQAYAALEGSPEVYVVSNLADKAERGLLSLLSKNLTVLDNQSIKHFSLYRASDQAEFSFSVQNPPLPTPKDSERPAALSPLLSPMPSPVPTPSPQALESRQWELVSPLRWTARSGDLNSMVSELANLLPVEYVAATDVDAARFGLDKPAYRVSLQSDYDKVLLEIGAAAGPHQRYARVDRYPLIFTLNMSSLSMIDRPLQELCSPYVANLDISQVSEIEVLYQDDAIEVKVDVPTRDEREKDPARKERFVVNGDDANVRSTANEHYFKQFYRSLIALQTDGLDAGTPTDDAVEFKIVYTLKAATTELSPDSLEKKTERVEVGLAPRDADTDFILLNGRYTGFYLKKNQLEKNKNGLDGFLKTWPRLQTAIKNNVDGIYDGPRD